MPTRETIRSRIDAYFAALARLDVDGVLACYAPGCTVEVVAPGPFEGEHPAAREGLDAFFGAMSEIEFEILGVLVDGDCAAVEVRSQGRMASGAEYRNRYHDFFRFDESGRITAFREYPTYPTPE